MSNKITATLAILGLVVALGVAIFKSSGTGTVDPNIAVLIQSISSLVEKLGPSDETFGAIGTRFPNGLTSGPNTDNSAVFTVGSSTSATGFKLIIANTCNPLIPGHVIAASSTMFADCAVTGAQSGDIILWSPRATSTTAEGATVWDNIRITGASASTTNGFVTFGFANFSGTSQVLPSSVASSVPFMLFRR